MLFLERDDRKQAEREMGNDRTWTRVDSVYSLHLKAFGHQQHRINIIIIELSLLNV